MTGVTRTEAISKIKCESCGLSIIGVLINVTNYCVASLGRWRRTRSVGVETRRRARSLVAGHYELGGRRGAGSERCVCVAGAAARRAAVGSWAGAATSITYRRSTTTLKPSRFITWHGTNFIIVLSSRAGLRCVARECDPAITRRFVTLAWKVEIIR